MFQNQLLLLPKARISWYYLQINSNNDFENECVKNRSKDSYITVKARGLEIPGSIFKENPLRKLFFQLQYYET